MSEMLETDNLNSRAVPQGTATGTTAGSLLREAREAAGVHVAALAVALKVPAHKLEALEADRYEVFPDVVFLRALASSVCRTLKVDVAPVLALLPTSAAPRLAVDHGINASFKDGKTRALSASGSAISKSVIGVVLVLLLAALAVVFVPRAAQQQSASVSKSSQDESQVVVEAPAAATQFQAPAASSPVETAPQSVPNATSNAITATAPALAAASVPAVSATPFTGAPLAASGQQPVAPVADDGLLVITASAPSWVQVRSLSGGGTTQKTLAAGDKLVAPGSPPWAVVIGKADATTVMVRGKPMDVSSIARENVARFEVK